jgi:SUN domain-containing protein 1/2
LSASAADAAKASSSGPAAASDAAAAAAGAEKDIEALRAEVRAELVELSKRASTADVAVAADVDKKLDKKLESWKGKPMVTRTHVADEVRAQLERFKSDKTGRVDYALFSGGGKVVGHSVLSPLVSAGDGFGTKALKSLRGGTHPKADEWVITATTQAAGECLALRGNRGHVDIRLREAVHVDAVTIEHVPRGVAYDITSAPKDVSVLGWNRTRTAPAKNSDALAALGSFRYAVDASAGSQVGSTQTFALRGGGGGAVDHVRFEVRSNYGNDRWTCLYRLRVHGTPVAKPREPVLD